MTTRRELLLAAAGLVTASAASLPFLPSPLQAKAPLGVSAPANAYRYRIGSFEVTALFDGSIKRPLDAGLVTNAPFDEVKAALSEAFLPTDSYEIPFTTLAVNTGSQVILIDTGTGGKLAPTAGRMLAAMELAGIKPEQVDTVLFSHFHADHIQGLRNASGALNFPNAEIVVPEAEWAYWADEGQASRAPEGRKGNFKLVETNFAAEKARIRRIKGGEEVVPGITAISTFGHTPGHTSYQIASGNSAMIALGDLTNRPELFVKHPEWSAMFDMDAAMARENRFRMLDRCAADKLLVAGYHFPFPAAGFIRKAGKGYELAPVTWSQL
jgi:glyoxylase-like metal-dependent hydrolase (beta-lactamase superfamily II)